MNEPLVSVVTITRNRGNLLKRCVSSVLSQTYKNIEHVVVDGASDDNTDEVIATFRDKRLKYVKLESNWPIKETLDYGVSLCSGKYVTFLDSDDEYLPPKIEKQVKLIESLSEDYGFVYCWMTYYDSETGKISNIHKAELRGDVAEKVISSPVISGTPTLMFRVDVIKEVGGWKSKDEIGIMSDWELCARVCQNYKVDYVPESLVNVYENHGMIRQSDGVYYEDTYNRLIKFHNYFLITYSNVFKIKPWLASSHYYYMFVYSLMYKKKIKACKYIIKSILLNPKYVVLKVINHFYYNGKLSILTSCI